LDKNGAHEEQDVRKLVEDFGKELQKVSLLAPEDLLIQSIKENYGSFITPDLLQKWLDDPQSTPGRMVSSPWPDHIDILDMEMNDKNQYTVNGEIVEVTSTELENGGAAARPCCLRKHLIRFQIQSAWNMKRTNNCFFSCKSASNILSSYIGCVFFYIDDIIRRYTV